MFVYCLTNTVSFSNFSSEFTIKPWSIAITYCENFGWNALPRDSEECLGPSDYRTLGLSNRRTIELSDISDHDASIIFIECPKFQTRSFQREIWLYKRMFVIFFCCLTNTVSFSNFSSEFTIKPWSIAITYCDNFGWNAHC
jgi:hypothetical protein